MYRPYRPFPRFDSIPGALPQAGMGLRRWRENLGPTAGSIPAWGDAPRTRPNKFRGPTARFIGNCAVAADRISFVLSRTPRKKNWKLPKPDELLVKAMARPLRAVCYFVTVPRALPWADILRPDGALGEKGRSVPHVDFCRSRLVSKNSVGLGSRRRPNGFTNGRIGRDHSFFFHLPAASNTIRSSWCG